MIKIIEARKVLHLQKQYCQPSQHINFVARQTT